MSIETSPRPLAEEQDRAPARETAPAEPLAAARELTAADVMSRMLLTVSPDQHILLAWELLVAAGVHHLPVVENGRCLALLDDRVLAREWAVGPLSQAQRTVRELCAGPAPSVSPDTPVGRVAYLMHLTDSDAVTVIDNQRLVGLVTAHDLIAILAGAPRPTQDRRFAPSNSIFAITPVLPR